MGIFKTTSFRIEIQQATSFGVYIVDFYCHKLKLIVEVDGSVHGDREVEEIDKERQRQLEFEGLKGIRFTNEEVLRKKEIVIEKLIY